jgi:hypothetical protein
LLTLDVTEDIDRITPWEDNHCTRQQYQKRTVKLSSVDHEFIKLRNKGINHADDG